MKNNIEIRYEAFKDMRIAESQIQWERYSAMLVVNTIFIGLIGFTYSKEFEIPLIIQFFLPIMGVFLCLLWLRMTSRGFMWVTFWTENARHIEEKYKNKYFNPFIQGNEYKNQRDVTFNTRNSSYLIIFMLILIYSSVLLEKLYPYIFCFCKLNGL